MSECTAPYHDRRSAYWLYRCRCPATMEDKRRYARQWERPHLHGALVSPWVDATGTLRRLRALNRIGWPLRSLTTMLGWSPTSMPGVLMNAERVERDTAERVIRLYDRLSMTPGPSDITRRRAERKGWAPPLAWDDDTIDDPAAEPYQPHVDRDLVDELVVERIVGGDYQPNATRAERREAIRQMVAAGKSTAFIAGQLRCHPREVSRCRARLRAETASPTPDALEATA